MQKESKEFNAFLGSAFNGGYSVLEDGAFKLVDDLPKLLPTLLDAQPGLQGLGNYTKELANATIGDKEENKAAFADKLVVVPQDDAYDLTEGIHGIQCLLSYGFRRGKQAGKEELIEELKSGRITVDQL